MSSTDQTTLAAITHVLALFTWVIGPAIVLVASEDEFVKQNAKNALNWQIFFTIYSFVAGLSLLVFVGFVLLPLVLLVNLIFCILAAVKASNNEAWTYPLTVDLI